MNAWASLLEVYLSEGMKKEQMHEWIPREVVGDDGAGDGHLLKGEDELADPDEAHGVVPDQVLEGLLHLELHQPRAVALHRGPCGSGGSRLIKSLLACSQPVGVLEDKPTLSRGCLMTCIYNKCLFRYSEVKEFDKSHPMSERCIILLNDTSESFSCGK